MMLVVFIIFIVAFIFWGVHLVENSPAVKNKEKK